MSVLVLRHRLPALSEILERSDNYLLLRGITLALYSLGD